MSKKKKLKPGQLCTIVDERTGDRYVIQAKRYQNSDLGICPTCIKESPISLPLCPLTYLTICCFQLFDPDVYPKIIKHVKNS